MDIFFKFELSGGLNVCNFIQRQQSILQGRYTRPSTYTTTTVEETSAATAPCKQVESDDDTDDESLPPLEDPDYVHKARGAVELNIAMFFIDKLAFSFAVANPLDLTITTHSPSKSIPAVRKTLRQLRKAGFAVEAILTDREGAVLALREELGDRGIRVNATGAGQHVPVAKNKIRPVEERGRCVLSSPLPFKLPRPLIRWLIAFCTQRINTVQRRTRADAAITMELFLGRKINFSRDVSVGFGDFVRVIEPIDNPITKASVHQPRTEPAIALPDTKQGGICRVPRSQVFMNHHSHQVDSPTHAEQAGKLLNPRAARPAAQAMQLKPRPRAPRPPRPPVAAATASEAPNVPLPPTFDRTPVPTLEGALHSDQLRESALTAAPQKPEHRGGTTQGEGTQLLDTT